MIRTAFGACLLAASTALLAAPPSDESVQQLLEVTKARSMIEQVHASMEQMVRAGMAQAIGDRSLTPEQKRIVDLAPSRLADVMRQEMNWDTMRPLYAAIYKDTFDQSDVDGLIAFYRSPVGQSFLAKMPSALQRSMAITQSQLQTLLPKLKTAIDQLLQEAKLPVSS